MRELHHLRGAIIAAMQGVMRPLQLHFSSSYYLHVRSGSGEDDVDTAQRDEKSGTKCWVDAIIVDAYIVSIWLCSSYDAANDGVVSLDVNFNGA